MCIFINYEHAHVSGDEYSTAQLYSPTDILNKAISYKNLKSVYGTLTE